MYRAIDESMSMSYLIIYMTELAENNVHAVSHAIYVLCVRLSLTPTIYICIYCSIEYDDTHIPRLCRFCTL